MEPCLGATALFVSPLVGILCVRTTPLVALKLTKVELRQKNKQLKNGKAAGIDEILPSGNTQSRPRDAS